MKVINKIAKAELSQFFYSPIAWLVLIVFTAQSGITFVNNFETQLQDFESTQSVLPLTERIFTRSWGGMLTEMIQYLYLYIPLLTMGLISKEKANGSIKLLFSSPISNGQVIMGKFVSMLVLGLILIGVLFMYGLFSYFTIENFVMPHFLTALLGIYLLICAYAAVGLFMSTLTSHQVVAVVSTLGVLTVLNLVGTMGENIPFIRDIAYWLSLKGRTEDMMKGLISSVDLIYFILMTSMFLLLSICKLNNERKRLSRKKGFARYATIVVLSFAIGQLTMIPYLKCYYDSTTTKVETLTRNSQNIMKDLDGPMTITAYVNLLDPFYQRALPKNQYKDQKLFEKYARFKPEIKFKYVYYWAETNNPRLYATYPNMTEEEIFKTMAEKLELDPKMFKSAEEANIPDEIKRENHRFTRIIERGNGNKAVLRLFTDQGYEPSERQISAAMRRLSDGPCQMAFLTGHGEPSIYRIGERGLTNFTTSKLGDKTLVNNGFDVFEINLQEQRLDTTKVDILVLTQTRTAYTEEEVKQIKEYIAKGGNMIIACETGCQDYMNPLLEEFGVQFMPGRIMQNNPNHVSTLVLPKPTQAAAKEYYSFTWMNRWRYKSPMLNAVGIDLSQAASKGVDTFAIFETDSTGYWNELTNIGYTETEAEFNPEKGEVETAFVMAAKVSRKVGDKEQRILLTGDTDWMTNGERAASRNKVNKDYEHLEEYSLDWLTYGKYPVNVKRSSEPDRKFKVTTTCIPAVKGTFWFGIPLIMIISCIAIQIKRKRK